jgi:hypothetical protein
MRRHQSGSAAAARRSWRSSTFGRQQEASRRSVVEVPIYHFASGGSSSPDPAERQSGHCRDQSSYAYRHHLSSTAERQCAGRRRDRKCVYVAGQALHRHVVPTRRDGWRWRRRVITDGASTDNEAAMDVTSLADREVRGVHPAATSQNGGPATSRPRNTSPGSTRKLCT